ncbi:MAG: Asp-tRNA(Asn)/Glu-tRNA(Gln) amidotransferase subunit GatA [Candidatus Dojkabacteria bacterium]|nr:Asp-tRNA(Asn)/Glu-tRNA(Gln) amidotransferase subunit GatA [Candidatus Dojkabacteria bacterium]
MDNYTITQLREKLLSKEISVTDAVKYYLKRISSLDKEINSYITVCTESALEKAKELDRNFDKVKESKLFGIPIAVKDVFSTKDIPTTCASHILDSYTPVYNATVIERILKENAIILGKTNLDEFCHGSSTITSYYGATRNPINKEYLPGGSSGGSSAATALDLCTTSLGTETAGSIRLPASWCGVVGLKPTYGRVPRYGVLAMGSSLDCPGPITKDVKDSAYMLGIIAGHDTNDFTSSKEPVHDYLSKLDIKGVKGMKLAIPKEYLEMDIEKGVRDNFAQMVKILKELGATVEEIPIMNPKFAMAVYTLTCRSEVSSNLARYDGTRYGLSKDTDGNIQEFYKAVRGEGFGKEAKRRIMTGTFSLSAGYADEYFKKAEKVRKLIKEDLENILKTYDAIISPTTPSIALKDKDADNPLFGEMADILAEGSSEAGLPGLSIPSGLSECMPTGIQFIGRYFDEQSILNLGYSVESTLKAGV